MPKIDTKPEVKPFTLPGPDSEPRYDPGEQHCPGQRVRTVRRVRREITES